MKRDTLALLHKTRLKNKTCTPGRVPDAVEFQQTVLVFVAAGGGAEGLTGERDFRPQQVLPDPENVFSSSR